jgi:hypothetical protein
MHIGKKVFTMLLWVIPFLLLIGCGGGGGDAAKAMKVTKSLDHESNKTVTIKGENGDRLEMTIPPLPLRQAEVNLTITLEYRQGIPTIIADKELYFTTPVILSFYVPQMVEQNMTLVYKGEEEDIYLPVTISDGTFTANLWHFSSYGFAQKPDSDRLLEDIRSRLTSNSAKAEHDRFEDFNADQLDELRFKIEMLPESEQKPLIEDIAYIIEKSIDNSVKYYTDNPPCYFDNLCLCDAFDETIDKLYDAHTYLGGFFKNYASILYEEDAILSESLLRQLLSLAQKFKEDSFVAWKTIALPECGPELDRYVSCSLTYQRKLEVMERFYMHHGLGGERHKELLALLESRLTEAANTLLSDPNSSCDCLKRYRALMIKYFSQSSAALIVDLTVATTDVCSDQCPYLWEITVQQNGTLDAEECFGIQVGGTITVSGYATFGPVMLYPDYTSAPDMTNEEFAACQPYMDRHTAIPAAVQHFVIEDEESDTLKLELDYTDYKGVDALLMQSSYLTFMLPYAQFENRVTAKEDFALTDTCAISYEFKYLK